MESTWCHVSEAYCTARQDRNPDPLFGNWYSQFLTYGQLITKVMSFIQAITTPESFALIRIPCMDNTKRTTNVINTACY